MFTPAEFEARRAQLEAELGEPITLDGLTADWRIFQRRKGHRHSTDDLLTAWYALENSPPTARCLDLRANGLQERVDALHGDLRELTLADRFPLITGSPPYFDVNAGIVPADSQKAHARFELRGDVRDYARAARRHLEETGLFVLCFPFPQKERALAALRAEGFTRIALRDVVPREGLPPLFSVFACRVGLAAHHEEAPFVVRHGGGGHTQAMHDVRARFGWPPSVRAGLPAGGKP